MVAPAVPQLATARSAILSPLKSATVTELGLLPASKCWAGPKVPSPFPNRTATELVRSKVSPEPSATTRSRTSSPLKSPTAMELAPFPTQNWRAGSNLPAPLAIKIETSLEARLATAKSERPSPLKSPTAIENGRSPTFTGWSRGKRSVTKPEQDGNGRAWGTGGLPRIGDRQIRNPIAIQVTGGDEPRRHAHREGLGRPKRTVAPAHQNECRVRLPINHREILVAVSIKVGRGNRGQQVSDVQCSSGRESPVPL